MSKPCKHKDNEVIEGCVACRLGRDSLEYQKAWDLPLTAKPQKKSSKPSSTDNKRAISLPCIHLGEEVLKKDGSSKKWFNCDHEPSHGVVCSCTCNSFKCKDYSPNIPREWIEEIDRENPEQTDYWQIRKDQKKTSWANDPLTIKTYQIALEEFLEVKNSYEKNKSRGKGIVLLGGGVYAPSLCITIQMIRKFSSLPIELFHRGEEEPIDEKIRTLPNIQIWDLSKDPEFLKRRQRGGWESKSYIFKNNSFEQFLFLDADCYPVSSFDYLFDSLDNILIWNNVGHADGFLNLKTFNLENTLNIPVISGGTYLIDKEKCWPLLNIYEWLDNHSEFTYHHGCGDQDMMKISLLKTNTSPQIMQKKCIQHNKTLHLYGLKEELLFLHRYQCKFTPETTFTSLHSEHTPPLFEQSYPYEKEVWSHYIDYLTS